MNRDEIRRHLRDTDRAQAEADRTWRGLLQRVFERPDTPAATKAAAVGAPGRRQVLRLGGTAVVGAAVLAACGSDEQPGVILSGTTEPVGDATTTASVPTTAAAEGAASDLQLVRTGRSLELLAIDVYDRVVRGDLPANPLLDTVVTDMASLFRDHHQAHAERLAGLIDDLGGAAVTTPNEQLTTTLVERALPTLTSEARVVAFAREMEDLATSTYSYATGVLSEAPLRQAILSIGAVEARHSTGWAMVDTLPGVVTSAFIDVSGPARIPADALLTEKG